MGALFTTLDGLKSRAKKLKKLTGIKHQEALDLVARDGGYKHFADARQKLGGAA